MAQTERNEDVISLAEFRNFKIATRNDKDVFKNDFIRQRNTDIKIESTIITTNKESNQYYSDTPNKGSDLMDWQEKYIDKVDRDVSDIKKDIHNMESNIENKISTQFELFRNEMRHLDNQRVADMREIRDSLTGNMRHVQNMSQATIIGVASMVIAVMIGIGGIWWTVWSSQQNIIDMIQKIPK